MVTPEQILKRCEKAELYKANEAETRHKIIDDVIVSILGWSKDDYQVEERIIGENDSKYADYIIRTGMSAFIIEAKRIGSTFNDIPGKRKVKLSGSILQGDLGKAIQQVREYAYSLSIPFAAVTNGAAWIVFPTQRTDQIPINESSALIFHDLKSVLQDRYAEFHELLSRDAVISGSLENEFYGRISNQIENRRLNLIHSMGFSRTNKQHTFYPAIQNAVSIAFTEDVMKTPELLENCYVNTPERVKFDQKIQMYIKRREANLSVKPIKPMGSTKPNLQEILDIAKQAVQPLAILVLGEVGAGKSTFLNHTRYVTSKDYFYKYKDKSYPHWIYIDFRSFSPSESPKGFIVSKIKEYINNDEFLSDHERCIKHAYKSEVETRKRGIWHPIVGNKEKIEEKTSELYTEDYEKGTPYVETILKYTVKNCPVYLVIDNVDQFDEETQSKVFLDAMAFSRSLHLNLLCSLRDATYHKHKDSAIFDAFEYDVIYIDAPKIDAVLSRRFAIAKHLLKDKEWNFMSERGQSTYVQDLSITIELIQSSVLGTEVGEFLTYASSGNIRLCLELTRNFLMSGYTEPVHAIHTYQKDGRYLMPRHEAVRGILLGGERVYSEETATIGNIFDARLSKTEAQFLRIFILSALVKCASSKKFTFLEGRVVLKYMNTMGYGKDITKNILEDLCEKKFADNISFHAEIEQSKYVPTRLGGYVLRDLIGEFMFIENMLMDTFIHDKKVWDLLDKLCQQINDEQIVLERLKLRIDRAKIFYKFVKENYQILKESAVNKGLPTEWCSDPLENQNHKFEQDCQNAIESASRNKARKVAV